MLRDFDILLEDEAQQLGPELLACGDVSLPEALCRLRPEALSYIADAADDRELITRFVEWLIEAYSTDAVSGHMPATVARALGVEVAEVNRIIGFLYPVAGLINVAQAIDEETLGCVNFSIDHAVPRFRTVRSFGGLVQFLEQRRASSASPGTKHRGS